MPILSSYVNEIIKPLGELIAQDNIVDVPAFEIEPNSDFNLISSNMSSLALTLGASDNENTQVAKIFDTIVEYFEDNRNLNRLQAIEQTSKSFSVILENSYGTINNTVATMVDTLKAKVENRYIELMRREKAEDLLDGRKVEPTESDYIMLTWDKLKGHLRQNEIVERACENAGINSHELTLLNSRYVVNKLNFTKEFTTVTIPAEVRTNIDDKLVGMFVTDKSGITKDQVMQFFTMLTSPNMYASFAESAARMINDIKNIANNSVFLLQQTNNFDTFSESVLKLIGDDLSPETMQTLSANLEAVKKTVYGIQYWLLLNKEVRFSGKLILTQNIINGPAYEEFVQSGNSISAIHNYLKAFYLNTTLPADGISLEVVRSTDASEKLALVANKMKYSEQYLKSKCLVGAYEDAMNWFIKDTVALESFAAMKEESSLRKFSMLARSKASLLGGNLANVDKILYDVVIKTFYDDTLIATMYKYLDHSFVNLAETNEDDITNESILESQCSATVELLVDYLFGMLVKTKDPFVPKA